MGNIGNVIRLPTEQEGKYSMADVANLPDNADLAARAEKLVP